MTKKLVINCAFCDTRKILEENYSHYENIIINAATVLTNSAGKGVLSKLPVTMNCAHVEEIEGDVELKRINGREEIKKSDKVPEKNYFMMVNGNLTIEPGTEKYLEKCVGLTVNGSVTYPESMGVSLVNMKVNGRSVCYPDEAVVLKPNTVIDKLFTLRAKKNLYWSAKRMVMVDPQLDGEQLKNKGAFFSAKEIILAQSKAEEMLDLIDEKAEIIVVPDGTTVIFDDVTLDEAASRRYGTKLYVIGDVAVPKENCLEQVEYLNVRGDAKVLEEQKKELLEKITEISGDIRTFKHYGFKIEDKTNLKITKWMLEQQPEGLEVVDCAMVKIAEDIPKELIAEKLSIQDCGIVKCSEEQQDAVELICQDVGSVGEDNDIVSIVDAALGENQEELGTKVINAADYVM